MSLWVLYPGAGFWILGSVLSLRVTLVRYLITRASQITHFLPCNSFHLVLKNETHKMLNFHCTVLEATSYFNDYGGAYLRREICVSKSIGLAL